jgi:hypothetical protein
MQHDNTRAVNALFEERCHVLQDDLAEALPLTEQEDTQLRDLEQATVVAMKQVGQQFLLFLIGACRPALASTG